MDGSSDLAIVSGRVHPELTARICGHLGVEPLPVRSGYHRDGDEDYQCLFDPFDRDVVVVQPTAKPGAMGLMELLIIIDALQRAEARSITATIPYVAYGREERMSAPFRSITGALVLDLLKAAGANRIIWINPHAESLGSALPKPCVLRGLTALPMVAVYLETVGFDTSRLAFAGPDFNASKYYAKHFLQFFPGATLVTVAKDRKADEKTEIMFLLGDVRGKIVVLMDDMWTTLTSGGGALDVLYANGAEQVWLMAVHPVCVAGAWQRMADPRIHKVITTNTLPTRWEGGTKLIQDKLVLLDISPLLAESIRLGHGGTTRTQIGKVAYWRKRVGCGLQLTMDPARNESPALDLWDAVDPLLGRLGVNMDKKIDNSM